jgi:two-component system C4-dicarboxylate transport sensor histidine kinase DctB
MDDLELIHLEDIEQYKQSNFEDIENFLNELLQYIRRTIHCDAGTIYLKDDQQLTFYILQNDTLPDTMQDSFKEKLKNNAISLEANRDLIAVRACSEKKMLSVDDIYNSDEYNFTNTKKIDKELGYESHSILAIPLLNRETNESIGVLQFINKIVEGKHTPFTDEDKKLAYSMSSIASISLYKVHQGISELIRANQKLRDHNQNLKMIVNEEVNKNLENERALLHQSRFAQMGEIINMLAHQWRQPLGSISAASANIEFKIDQFENGCDDVNTQRDFLKFLNQKQHLITQQTQLLSDVIDDFSHYFRPNQPKEMVKIDKLLDKALGMLSESFQHHDITVVRSYQTLGSVRIYRNELIQVLLNILKNAQDSLNKKKLKDSTIWVHLTQEGDKTTITICDNAGGVPLDILPSIFEPYFSTKDEKNGTGLGLYISKILVESYHLGTLEAHNTDRGACFEIVINEPILSSL